jgi:hypothetical protein
VVTAVAFYEGENLLGIDTAEPYSLAWNGVADGCYTIVARASDDAGRTNSHAVDVTVGSGCDGQAPFGGAPAVIPGVVEAENFDQGGAGVAYFDTSSGNNGGAYRDEDVDLEQSSEHGFNVGWMDEGEWLEYTVDVEQAGRYRIDARVASQDSGGAFRLLFGGSSVGASYFFPATGGWQDWVTRSVEADLPAGVTVMRFENLGEAGVEFNLNRLVFTRLGPDCVADLAAPFGVLDLADIGAFTSAFLGGDPLADFDENGVFDLADIGVFVTGFTAGCP